MKTHRWLIVSLVALTTVACATSAPPRVYSEFEDIPVPNGLTYQPNKSLIIESPSVKAARLIYRGRIEVVSLRQAMRTILEANGWRHVSTSTTAERGTTQVYEKAGTSVEVSIYEGVWFTYVALGASKPLLIAQPPAGSAGFQLESSAPAGPLDSSAPVPPSTATGDTDTKPGKSPWARARDGIKDFFTRLFSD